MGQKKDKKAGGQAFRQAHPIISRRNGYLPNHADSGGSYFMSFSPDASSRTTWKTNL